MTIIYNPKYEHERSVKLAIFDLFSKRKKRESGEASDVFTYDKIPAPLKVQIIHIWHDSIGFPKERGYNAYNRSLEESVPNKYYHFIIQTLRREAGFFSFFESTKEYKNSDYSYGELCKYFMSDKASIDTDLDIIELTFRLIDTLVRDGFEGNETADAAIEELNQRFLEHGIGYSYSDRIIIRKDSEFVHSEATKPALLVLKDKRYKTAESEFLAAHQHNRHGRNSEALMEACKAFESTMKIICTKRKWIFDPKKSASHLIEVCLQNKLFADYFHSSFSNLKGLLESGIPTPRNKQSGHGAGTNEPHSPSNELTAYVLHMTASTILFLVESEKALS